MQWISVKCVRTNYPVCKEMFKLFKISKRDMDITNRLYKGNLGIPLEIYLIPSEIGIVDYYFEYLHIHMVLINYIQYE